MILPGKKSTIIARNDTFFYNFALSRLDFASPSHLGRPSLASPHGGVQKDTPRVRLGLLELEG
jgi:hypothetical protein